MNTDYKQSREKRVTSSEKKINLSLRVVDYFLLATRYFRRSVLISVNPWLNSYKSRREGFTLIEVIVAIAILAISLVMVMQLFSGGLRASRTSCDYTRAIVHAKDKMEELSINPVQGSGEFEDGFKWESGVQPLEELNKEFEGSGFNLLKMKVKISWFNTAKQQKTVELVSLKAVGKGKQ